MSITNVKNIFSTYTFDDSTEAKNYHRVLFKPGVSVQARELTEMQSNLQRQIDYHGQYSFADGSRVVGGEVALNVDYDYIKVESSYTNVSGTAVSASAFISSLVNAANGTLTNANGVVAQVIQVISEAGVDLKSGSNKSGILESGNTSDALTIYIKYVTGSGTANSNTFAAGELLTSSTNAADILMVGGGSDTNLSDGGTVTASSGAVATNPIGKGSQVTISEGVYFISGNFVYVAADSIILQKYDNTPSNIIGLQVTESVATAATDTNLVDNATGFPNASAPGADRYKIATQLIKADPASPTGVYKNYIILLTITNGVKQIEVAPAAEVNTELTKRLARRTSEESGNYALKPFTLDIKEYLDDGTNGGFKTAAVIAAEEGFSTGNENALAKAFGVKKYVVGVEPNVAYVQGYRTENISTNFITVDKPREVSTAPKDYIAKNNSTSRLDIGNYVKIDVSSASTSVGFPDIENFSELALIDTAGGAPTPIALADTVVLANAAGTFQGTYYVHDHSSDTKFSSVGGGSGARFKIVIDSAGKVVVEVTDGGKDYDVDDTFTVLGSAFTGGADSTNNLTFKVAQLGVGRARARAVVYESATVMKLYLFDIVMTSGTFARVDKVEQLKEITGGANNDFFGHFVSSADGKRFDATNNSLIFKLPGGTIKTAEAGSDKPVYTRQLRLYADNAEGSNKVFTDAIAADETLLPGAVLVSIGSKSGATPVRTTTASATASEDGLGRDVTIGGTTNGKSVCAIITVQKTGNVDNKKTKTFVSVADTLYKFDGSNPILLNAYDIYSLVSVKQGTASGADITDQFKLDNGQRANFYDEGQLIPIGNAAAGNVYITFNHYTHSAGEYITINSYPATTTTHDRNRIPLAVTPEGNFDLKDCIDFRPVKGTLDVHSNLYTSNATSTFKTSSTTKSVGSPALTPSSILTVDSEVWLPRIDKLILGRDGAYKVIKGLSSETPIAPEDPSDAMVIGSLRVAPFTYNAKAHVKQDLKDHKRYTMKHIGELNRRIKNLEYYTSLSLLEAATLAISVPDGGSDMERFKNGIFVEPFIGHGNGNVEHPDYHCAIDKALGTLRPKFDQKNIRLERKASETGIVRNGSLYTLPFTQRTFIDQPAATLTEFVNPYNVFTWNGVVKLSPDSDEWKDTEHRPDVLINETGQYDQLVGMIEESGVLGTVWNEWETNWTGINSDVQTFGHHGRDANNGNPNDVLLERTSGFNEWGGYEYLSGSIVTTTEFAGQSRSGLTTSITTDTETSELGSKIVETNYVPFIRSREIYFKAEMLKPDTKMYAFFNDVDITGYCAEKTYVEYGGDTNVVGYGDATAHPSATALVSDASGIIEGSFIIPNNSSLRFKTGTREFRLSDSPVNDKANEGTYAEAQYYAAGMLEVKQNTIISTKVPKIVTSEVNTDRVISETNVDDNRTTKWYDPLAQTILIEQDGGIFATSLDIFVAASEAGTAAGGAGIPLNVSIRETENGYPTQRIVPGSETILYPSSIQTPSNAADVVKNLIYTNHITSNGSVACPVTFEHPVYLSQDTEYAIVLISNSDTYKVCVAETGAFDLQTNARVAKQPYNGVFFKSQNGSTWTAEQGKDLKFKVKRAEFSGSGTVVTFVNDQLPVKKLKADPFFICTATVAGSAVLRVTHPNHGMFNGSSVTIAGAGVINTITVALLNATHVISDVEIDSYVITIAASAIDAMTESLIGGGANVTATENMSIDALVPYNETLQLPETLITYETNCFTGKSQDGSQSEFVGLQNLPLSINNNNFFANPIAIASAAEITAGTGQLENSLSNTGEAGKSIAIKCKFTTENTFLSPVIDANRASLFCISNRTNDADSDSGVTGYNKADHGRNYVAETTATGGSNLNVFITKEITLANEATQLDAYAEVHRPAGSSIDLYFKVKAAGDDSNFNDLPWYLFNPKEAIATKDSGVTHVEYSQLIENVVTGVAASVPSAGVQSVPIAPTRPDTGKTKHDYYREFGAYDALDIYVALYLANGNNDAHTAVAAALATFNQKQAKADAAMAAASGKVSMTITDPAGNQPTASQADGTTGGTAVITASPPADKFGSFAFKIVLRTNNSCKVPMVKNFRSIATT